ncbi:type II toxin-antitoxin system RelE family toxin [Pinibacter aurantiacus]|uniref:Type II toxin-antitoxin system RelE/ParE family toxin n=1 Tax=Pinibacter aurantiacus TaxID=2851599 RepID=A0A9E2W167_9BACT|nr:type II toxin-antitoxin system RelE/ParE family toxin [Pinibacter aurantiacus]MBV4355770.1 type II toxin-antitoxin system RelE/ParE family toxin [Pinibacter aurantiacus]
MEVFIERSYLKDLKSVPQYIIEQADAVIEKLKNADSLNTSGVDYKLMQGCKDKSYYRVRVGDYRIGLKYVKPTIVIITILKRGDIYKYFP